MALIVPASYLLPFIALSQYYYCFHEFIICFTSFSWPSCPTVFTHVHYFVHVGSVTRQSSRYSQQKPHSINKRTLFFLDFFSLLCFLSATPAYQRQRIPNSENSYYWRCLTRLITSLINSFPIFYTRIVYCA